MRPRTNQPGFSFVELLFSMAVVLVLAALFLGPTAAAARKKKLTDCAERMRKLNMSLTLYSNEHDGVFPAVAGARHSRDVLRLLVPAYTSEESCFGCQGGGYAYAMGLKRGEHSMLVADRFDMPASTTRGGASTADRGNHDGPIGNVLFADGHLEQFETASPRSLKIPTHATLLNP